MDGLVRFDGVRFTVFNKSNSPGISSNRFLVLHEDTNGDLWASTEDGGVVRYHQGRCSSYGKEHGLTSLHVVCFPIDNDGNLFALLINGQMMRWFDDKFLPVSPTTNSTTSEQVSIACHYCEWVTCRAYKQW